MNKISKKFYKSDAKSPLGFTFKNQKVKILKAESLNVMFAVHEQIKGNSSPVLVTDVIKYLKKEHGTLTNEKKKTYLEIVWQMVMNGLLYVTNQTEQDIAGTKISYMAQLLAEKQALLPTVYYHNVLVDGITRTIITTLGNKKRNDLTKNKKKI